MSENEPRKQLMVTLGVIIWVSFMCAALATMLFFATFDPVEIAEVATFPMELNRMGGYSAGFLLFWILLMANSCLVNWLMTKTPQSRVNSELESS